VLGDAADVPEQHQPSLLYIVAVLRGYLSFRRIISAFSRGLLCVSGAPPQAVYDSAELKFEL